MTDDITAIVLAGGAGRRVQGRDKGLIHWQGEPLVAHVIRIIAPQVDHCVISCNRNEAFYSRYSDNIVSDRRSDYQGPLAGLEAASTLVSTPYTLVVTCDMPQLPTDLVSRLLAALKAPGDSNNKLCYAHDGHRAQYLCAAMHSACLRTLPAYLDNGGRAVHRWYNEIGSFAVDFSDRQSCFVNYNYME